MRLLIGQLVFEHAESKELMPFNPLAKVVKAGRQNSLGEMQPKEWTIDDSF